MKQSIFQDDNIFFKSKEGLIRKIVIDKNGVKRLVWVKQKMDEKLNKKLIDAQIAQQQASEKDKYYKKKNKTKDGQTRMV